MKKEYLFIGGFVLLFILLQTCNEVRVSREKSRVSSLMSERDSLFNVVNKNGETISSQQAIITDNEEIIRQYSDSIFALGKKLERRVKRVISHSTISQEVNVDSLLVGFTSDDEVEKRISQAKEECREEIRSITSSMITVPRSATIDSGGIQATFTVKKEGVLVTSLSIKDTLSVRVVEEKGGFLRRGLDGKRSLFKKKRFLIQTKHSSPFFSTEWQTSLTYLPKKKFPLIPVAAAAVGTYLIVK